MVVPVGSLINAGVVVAGALVGMLLGNRLPERIRVIVFQGLGLCTLAIGMQMAFKTTNPLYMVGSILLGGILGEVLELEDRIQRGGEALKGAMNSANGKFTEGFVSSTLLFCIGSMAILGPLEEGLGGPMTTTLTKATLDFFAAMAFGAAYGSGVMFAAIPLLIYQGSITLFAAGLRPYLTDLIRAEIVATGGLMIVGIGINLLDLKKIRLSNLLPALVIVVVLCSVVSWLQQ